MQFFSQALFFTIVVLFCRCEPLSGLRNLLPNLTRFIREESNLKISVL